MTQRTLTSLAATTLGALLLLGHPAAQAAPVNQTFTMTADFGSLGTVSGSFSYDDAQTPASQGGEQFYDLTAFSVTLEGTTYDLGDLGDAFAVFIGNSFIGLQVTIDGVLTLSPEHAQQKAFFAYSGRTESMGSLRFGNVGTVDEPGALALLLLGAAAAAAARRRAPR
jgi:MYXO-CTERM domain-containing protein